MLVRDIELERWELALACSSCRRAERWVGIRYKNSDYVHFSFWIFKQGAVTCWL